MGRFIIRRLIGLPFVLLILITLCFFMVRLAPGSPFSTERSLSPEVEKAIMERYGLDKPMFEQYLRYLGGLLTGDLGPSFKYKDRTVNELIRNKFPVSLQLGLFAMAIAVLFGMGAGIVAGLKQNSAFDYSSMSIAMVGMTIPMFVTAPFFRLIFATHLGWFDIAGWGDVHHPELGLWADPKDIVLPAIALSLPYMALIARLTRAGILDVIHQDYIRTARAKGLSEKTVIFRHAIKGGILPVVSFLGPAFAFIITGSLVIEVIFNIPGLGQEFVNSALNRDYGMTLGLVIFIGTLLVVMNLVVDILYGFLDPRIRYE